MEGPSLLMQRPCILEDRYVAFESVHACPRRSVSAVETLVRPLDAARLPSQVLVEMSAICPLWFAVLQIASSVPCVVVAWRSLIQQTPL
jgi:hypothetical protein